MIAIIDDVGVAGKRSVTRQNRVVTIARESQAQMCMGGTNGNWDIIPKRAVTVGGAPVDLTAKEFDLLFKFAERPGRVYTRSQLLDLVWGYGHVGYEHTVNSHINRLRAKIERDPAKPSYILTVWGIGYKFNDRLDG